MRTVAPWLIILPPLLLLGQCTIEFFAVDACLDTGKLYDYANGICRTDLEHLPYIPYVQRSWHLLIAAAASIGVGIFVLVTSHKQNESSAF